MTVDSGEEFAVEVRGAFDDVDISAVPTPFTSTCDGHRLAPMAEPIVARGAKSGDVVAIDCCPLSECADTRPGREGQQQPHCWAHKKIRVATRPRALRPAWRAPHRSSMRRVSAVAASDGVSMRRLLVGMMMNIV
jgi:hypothetical protein